LPEIPTISESGYSGFDATSGGGIMVAGKTPRDIVAQINAAIVQAMTTTSVQLRLSNQGFVPLSSSPQEFETLLRGQMERMRTLINDIGLKVD
jgi:tripartite-type tricarboxylate transporter receptor subunit TctC